MIGAPEATIACPDCEGFGWLEWATDAVRCVGCNGTGRIAAPVPYMVELTGPRHPNMPLCAKCGREVDGCVVFDQSIATMQVSCHGEVETIDLGPDGEVNRQVCFKGRTA